MSAFLQDVRHAARLMLKNPGFAAVVTLALGFTSAAVGALACALPARRATRIDPLQALRHE